MDSEKGKISLLSNLKFSSFEKLSENFLKAKCYVLALGKNVNKSHFSKENVDRAYPTLAYVPVIGHLMVDDNGMYHLGGHDYHLDIKDLKLKSQCVPFGVALPSETPVYEEVTEEDGTVSTYLTCEVILWISRYPELAEAFYNDSVFTNQSMEILFSNSAPLKDDPTYTDIIDFSFDALCMLQKSDDDKFNVVPCFPSASIVPINYSIDKNEFSSLMNELKEELSLYFNKNNSEEKGGIVNLDKKLEILQKFNKTVDDLDFSIEDMSVEDLSVKMEELFGEKEPKAEPIAFSATYKEKRQALQNALDPIVVKDAEGNYVEETYFYIEDFSDEYVFVEKDHWTASDYDCKYGRFAYTFDETTRIATITGEFEEMVKVWLTIDEKSKLDEERANYETKYSELEREFSDYKADHSYFNSEFEELKEYRNSKEAEERDTAEKTIFKKYEKKIGETNEFSELKKNASNYSIKDLEKECLYIVGLYSFANELKHNTETPVDNSIKFSATHDNGEIEDPIEATYKKYLNK